MVDSCQNSNSRVLTRVYVVVVVVFFRRSRAANSVVSGRIIPKSELLQAFIVVLITGKNEEDPVKN